MSRLILAALALVLVTGSVRADDRAEIEDLRAKLKLMTERQQNEALESAFAIEALEKKNKLQDADIRILSADVDILTRSLDALKSEMAKLRTQIEAQRRSAMWQ